MVGAIVEGKIAGSQDLDLGLKTHLANDHLLNSSADTKTIV